MKDRKQHDILSVVKELEEDSKQLKSSQFVGGASFINYTTQSPDSYDFSVTLTAGAFAARRITFIPGIPGKYYIIRPSRFFRLNNPNVMASPQEQTPTLNVRVFTESPEGGYSWIIQAFNGTLSTHTYYVKLYFKGTASGTFNVTTI